MLFDTYDKTQLHSSYPEYQNPANCNLGLQVCQEYSLFYRIKMRNVHDILCQFTKTYQP